MWILGQLSGDSFQSEDKKHKLQWPIVCICLSLSFMGGKLSQVWVSTQRLEISHTLFLGEERMRHCRVRNHSSPLILPPSGGWHGNSLMNVCGKMHSCLMSILSILWDNHCFHICGTLYFPKMATTISPISQGSFRTLSFLHQEIESKSPLLESG